MSDLTRTRPNADQFDELIAAVKGVGDSIMSQVDVTYLAMLNEENYKTVMKKWFEANGCKALADLSSLCDKWYLITRNGWTGGVKFAIPAAADPAASDGTKTGDNYGLSCTPSTTLVQNTDDYAGIPLFACIDVNAYLDSDGKPHITAIRDVAGNFESDNPAKIVGVMQMAGWEKPFVDTTNGYYGWEYTDNIGEVGFQPLPEAVDLKDNSVRTWVVHGKYGFGPGFTCCSGQKQRVFDVSHNAQLSGVHTAWGNRYCGATSADDAFLKLMLYLKYGRLDSDRILHGCCNYNYDYSPAVAETGVERIIVTTAQGANLVVGSTVSYGSSARAAANVVDRCKITKIETVNIGGTDYSAVYVDNGGTTFDTATTGHLCTMPWHTGSTDGVLGSDGGIDPASDKYPVKIQGIEYMVGCYEVLGDAILVYGDNGGVNCCTPWICRDATKLATSKTADYRAAHGVPTPASSGWTYPKQMRAGSGLPELIFAIETGGSTSAGPRDGYYLLNNTSGSYEWLRFGALAHGVGNAGLSYLDGRNGLTTAYWAVGGRLSLTGNRGEFQAAA